MKFKIGMTMEGIRLSYGEGETERLVLDPSAHQQHPRRSYVYGHFDSQGVCFYIGKGTGGRAWASNRHPYWNLYVEKYLHGKFYVVILKDNLTSKQAEHLENLWIDQEGDTLINGVNAVRATDFKALARYHDLRDANRELIATAKQKEKSNPVEAIALYYKALDVVSEYVNIQYEPGLYGQLMREHKEKHCRHGDIHILDRLTRCLVRAGRTSEAADVAERYFETYSWDLLLSAAPKILVRVGLLIKNDGTST